MILKGLVQGHDSRIELVELKKGDDVGEPIELCIKTPGALSWSMHSAWLSQISSN